MILENHLASRLKDTRAGLGLDVPESVETLHTEHKGDSSLQKNAVDSPWILPPEDGCSALLERSPTDSDTIAHPSAAFDRVLVSTEDGVAHSS
jgi:hypothetical protein